MAVSKNSATELFNQLRRNNDAFLRLTRLLLLFQSRTRYLTQHYAPPLSFSESYILGELAMRAISIGDLAGLLHLDESTVSRLVKGLVKRKLIVSKPCPEDKRIRRLYLTPHGKSILKRDDQIRCNLMIKEFEVLSDEEQKALKRGLVVLGGPEADGPAQLRPGEHALRGEMKRITRELGMLGNLALKGDGFLGTDLTTLSHQILFAIFEHSNGLTIGDLTETIPFEQSNISRAVIILRDMGFLNSSDKDGGYKQKITFTRSGREKYLNTILDMRNYLSKRLERCDRSEIDLLVNLLSKLVNSAVQVDGKTLNNYLEPIKINDEAALFNARAFLIERYVEQKATKRLSSRIMSEEGSAWALRRDGKLHAVCETVFSGKTIHLINFASSEELSGSPEVISFIIEAAKSGCERQERHPILVKSESLAGREILKVTDGNSTRPKEVNGSFMLTLDELQAISPLR